MNDLLREVLANIVDEVADAMKCSDSLDVIASLGRIKGFCNRIDNPTADYRIPEEMRVA